MSTVIDRAALFTDSRNAACQRADINGSGIGLSNMRAMLYGMHSDPMSYDLNDQQLFLTHTNADGSKIITLATHLHSSKRNASNGPINGIHSIEDLPSILKNLADKKDRESLSNITAIQFPVCLRVTSKLFGIPLRQHYVYVQIRRNELCGNRPEVFIVDSTGNSLGIDSKMLISREKPLRQLIAQVLNNQETKESLQKIFGQMPVLNAPDIKVTSIYTKIQGFFLRFFSFVKDKRCGIYVANLMNKMLTDTLLSRNISKNIKNMAADAHREVRDIPISTVDTRQRTAVEPTITVIQGQVARDQFFATANGDGLDVIALPGPDAQSLSSSGGGVGSIDDDHDDTRNSSDSGLYLRVGN